MQSMIDNLINGNLKDARKQARKYSLDAIYSYLLNDFGWSDSKSLKAAVYLKTGECWQKYCDAV